MSISTTQRKPLSKKTRFEVFKRDSFKCQYCGEAAPTVVLEVDHIHPVAAGGTNDITNLVTACRGCNNGKAAVPLSDATAMEKSRRQLEELQERREQIAMMSEWQRGLIDLESQEADMVSEFWTSLVKPFGFTEQGRESVLKLIRRFGSAEVIEAMKIAHSYYINDITSDSVNFCWSKVGGICAVRKRDKSDPGYKEINYIRAIVRNRLGGRYYDHQLAGDWIRAAVSWGVEYEDLKREVRLVSSWKHFGEIIDDLKREAQSNG